MKQVGNFGVEVSPPYPCWVTIYVGRQIQFSFHHKELADLQYVIQSALRDCQVLLKDDAKEMG